MFQNKNWRQTLLAMICQGHLCTWWGRGVVRPGSHIICPRDSHYLACPYNFTMQLITVATSKKQLASISTLLLVLVIANILPLCRPTIYKLVVVKKVWCTFNPPSWFMSPQFRVILRCGTSNLGGGLIACANNHIQCIGALIVAMNVN